MSHTARTIALPSGARLTVTIDADLFDVAKEDRDFVFGIVANARKFVEEAVRQVAEHEGSKREP